MFIWHLERCSDNYHTSGGVVVIAKDQEEAMDLAEQAGCFFEEKEHTPYRVEKLADTDIAASVYIFPNAGCCG